MAEVKFLTIAEAVNSKEPIWRHGFQTHRVGPPYEVHRGPPETCKLCLERLKKEPAP